MSLTNLRTARTVEAQFNPPDMGAKATVGYELLSILGFSHQPMQFKQTANVESEVDLLFDRLTKIGGAGGGANYDSTRRFLQSLTLPSRGDSVLGGGPPDVLFVWPKLYSFTCRVMDWQERHLRIARDGRSTLMTVRLRLNQFSTLRILSEDVEEYGLEVPA